MSSRRWINGNERLVQRLLAVCVVACVVAALPIELRADTAADAAHAVIDREVWAVFHRAFETLDAERLNDLYADDALRATPEGLDTQGAFMGRNLERFAASRARGERVALDFWIDSRRTDATTSYEVGFYRVRITAVNGAELTTYGQFHIVLKRRDGQWKIVQDWDTTTIGGRPITSADFDRREPLSFAAAAHER